MNRHGALLDELGFYPGLLDPLVREWLVPLCSQIPAFAAVGGGQLNSHKSFVVTYKLGEDEHLSEHFDNAEVTLNANLARYMASPRACKCSPRRSRLPTGGPVIKPATTPGR